MEIINPNSITPPKHSDSLNSQEGPVRHEGDITDEEFGEQLVFINDISKDSNDDDFDRFFEYYISSLKAQVEHLAHDRLDGLELPYTSVVLTFSENKFKEVFGENTFTKCFKSTSRRSQDSLDYRIAKYYGRMVELYDQIQSTQQELDERPLHAHHFSGLEEGKHLEQQERKANLLHLVTKYENLNALDEILESQGKSSTFEAPTGNLVTQMVKDFATQAGWGPYVIDTIELTPYQGEPYLIPGEQAVALWDLLKLLDGEEGPDDNYEPLDLNDQYPNACIVSPTHGNRGLSFLWTSGSREIMFPPVDQRYDQDNKKSRLEQEAHQRLEEHFKRIYPDDEDKTPNVQKDEVTKQLPPVNNQGVTIKTPERVPTHVQNPSELSRLIDKKIDSLEKVLSINEAKWIMGQSAFTPVSFKRLFEVTPEAAPPIPFSRSELEKAKQLGQKLVYFPSKTADGEPFTVGRMLACVGDKIDGRLRLSQEWINQYIHEEENDPRRQYREELLNTVTSSSPRCGWRLVSFEPLEGDGQHRSNYYEQTDAFITYLEEQVFTDTEVPEVYRDAIKEFRDAKKVLDVHFWRDEQKILGLAIHQLVRINLAETMYMLLSQNKLPQFGSGAYKINAHPSSEGGELVSVAWDERYSPGLYISRDERLSQIWNSVAFFSRAL